MASNAGTLAAVRAAGLSVEQCLTPYNFTRGTIGRIKYIVIHYVGATGDAMANAKYYASKYIGASAHWYVGFKGQIVQSVEDHNVAWAVGSKSGYRHPDCRNANSVSIEMCVRNPNGSVGRTDKDAGWYFERATIEAAQKLVRVLMEQYGVPANRVLRHYDVTGKCCPAPYVNGQLSWADFMSAVTRREEEDDDMTQEQFDKMFAKAMWAHEAQTRSEPVSPWARESWEKATAKGVFDGTSPGAPLTREQAAVVLDRIGLLK